MKYTQLISIVLSLTSTLAQNFCSTTDHTGESVKETSNKVGAIGDIGYELWSDSGDNSATFYSDGSFSCSFKNAKDYLCRSGLSFDSTKTHKEIGHIYADFKLVKQDIQDVDYSYIGIYGWTREPLVEFYVVDNWLSQYRPGDWVGNKKYGDFEIDGAEYTVYENTRTGPSIDGDNVTFKQYFSVRKEARDCGTIDITAHFEKWEELGLVLGKMHEAKVLGEAGSIHDGTSGTADFPYAKVYIEGAPVEEEINSSDEEDDVVEDVSGVIEDGDESEAEVSGSIEEENESEEEVSESTETVAQTTEIVEQPTEAATEPVEVDPSDFCSAKDHTGESVKETSNKVGAIGDIGYELWSDSGDNSATFYADGSFSCSFKNAKDYLCRSGLSFDSTKTHKEIGHIYADFKLVKQDIQDVDYSYIGIYGWTREPLVEFYVVDNWLSQYRPGDWVGNKKYGDFEIDGAEYTVYENTRTGPSIDGDNVTFKQYFSIRKEARDCGTIDITAHFEKWEELGLVLGKMHEAKVLGEAGSIHDGTSGTADFPYAKVYIKDAPVEEVPQPTETVAETTEIVEQPTEVATEPVEVDPSDFCSAKDHTGESVKETSNKVGAIGDIGYELWSDSGDNSATFYADGSFSCSFKNAKDYLCRSGLSFDSTKTHKEIGHIYADFKLVKQDIKDVDYSYIGIYGWTREPLVEYYVVDNWLSQYRPGDWVGNKKYGDFEIDGAEYTVYENTRTGPSIDGDNVTFKQYFSIRKEARDCGTIDITAHFEKWEELGLVLGKMHEAKVLGEAGSIHDGTSGTADFPYAKVYIKDAPVEEVPQPTETVAETTEIVEQPTEAATEPVEVDPSDFCSAKDHTGESVKETSNKVGAIGDIGYELWSDSGDNSATFYADGSFSCSFKNAKDYLCRSGLSFDSTKTHKEIGHIYADFKLVKQDIQDVDYSYIGIYGWTREPLVEFYVVDNWLSQYRPGDWVGNKKYGDFEIDGAEYTVYENTRTGPSIDGDNVTFKQYFSIRKEARDCGTIDITAHFEKWEELGLVLGKMHEAKVLGEAGSIHDGTSGTADFPYAKVYIKDAPVEEVPQPTETVAETTEIVEQPTEVATEPVEVDPSDFCSAKDHTGESVKETSNKVGAIGDIGYELWSDSGDNSATFYADGSFSCSFKNAKDYLCRSGLSFDSTKTHKEIGHIYADFKLVKQDIKDVDYSYIGIYGWTREPLVEYYVVDNWLSQYRPGDWVGNKKYGDFEIDGAEYTVYENTRTGPSIDGDNVTFKQYFSIRKEARDCGTIDITAHFEKWEELGLVLGKMHEAKVLGEAGSIHDGTSGTADFPYAKVYIKDAPVEEVKEETCSAKILAQGYSCCPKGCRVYVTDDDGDWGYVNNEWCGCKVDFKICAQGYPCCKGKSEIYFVDKDGNWGYENGDCMANASEGEDHNFFQIVNSSSNPE
ncbi:concanavalin A-like lectin/glucanase domain-containing protein [Neocallimastix lanati (nom. inval.)]|nr:concanavalin A-like lectin/glucanase domain-containing protein [Neocallimastix sp. JGI-2020a]